MSRRPVSLREWIFRCSIADPELSRKWRFLNLALLILTVLATVSGGALALLGARWIGQIGLLTALCYGILFAVNRTGRVVAVATSLIGLAIVAVVIAALDGTRDVLFAVIVPLLYVIPVTLAGALLSWRAVVAATALAALAMVWLYLFAIPQLGPYRTREPNTILALTILLVIVLVAVGSFVAIFNYQLMAERERVRAEKEKSDRLLLDVLPELERKKQDLETLTEELRYQVAARSRELTEVLARAGAPLAPIQVSPGDVVEGRYRVVRLLGAGGMGAVYEIERTSDQRPFALKMLTSPISGAAAARFTREAEIGARIRHPNVVAIVDVGIARGGAPFLVMELVGGGSLEDHRDRFGDVSWALPLLAQVAAGLAELHGAGVVHRDLKPSNVLLSGNGGTVARIADFGISRFGAVDSTLTEDETVDDTSQVLGPRSLTGTGALVGTPLYMPPEAAGGSRFLTAAADVFAFGLLAYELLAKAFPFPTAPVFLTQAEQPLPKPPPLDMPADVERLLASCLAEDPVMRPRIDAVREALERRSYAGAS
jgi:hypothetical protein